MSPSRRTIIIIDNDAHLGPVPPRPRPESGPPAPPVDRLPCQVQVRCNGAGHTVICQPDGRLYFSHHRLQDLRRDAARRERGRVVCRCAEVLWAWQRSIRHCTCYRLLPPGLRQAARDAHNLHTHRRVQRWRQVDDFAVGTGYEHPSFVARLIDRLLRQHWGLPPSVTVAACPSNVPYCFTLLIRDGVTTLLEDDIIPRHWVEDVYRAGPAFHEGRLVLWRFPDLGPRRPPADHKLKRCYPVRGQGGHTALEIDRVRVVLEAGGGLRVVEGPYDVRPATAPLDPPTAE
jgi:hypothetical protein